MQFITIGRSAKDISGHRFGRLLVAGPVRRVLYGRSHRLMWLCVCDCGVESVVDGQSLRDGRSQSCGCLAREMSAEQGRANSANVRHGMAYSSEFGIWAAMRQRCNNPKMESYARYGGRGIRVCVEWDNFENFYRDMGPRPSPQHSIDRKDNSGNYEPGNCRWATRSEQMRNTRVNNVVEAYGRKEPLVAFIPDGPYSLAYSKARRQIKKGVNPEAAIRAAT